MICSTNCFNKLPRLLCILLLGCLPACVKAPESSNAVNRIQVVSLRPDKASPQTAQGSPITWNVQSLDGVGKPTYTFEVSRNKEKSTVGQSGESSRWQWHPALPGSYRIRVRATDELGHSAESAWSPVFEIDPALEVTALKKQPDLKEIDLNQSIRWTADTAGGVGEKTFRFDLEKQGQPGRAVHMGSKPLFTWSSSSPGIYRFRVAVNDAVGARAESDWSSPIEVMAPLELTSLSADRPSPQAALGTPIVWTAQTNGGKGAITYKFLSLGKGVAIEEQDSQSPTWSWTPKFPGEYRIKVIATDTYGHKAQSDWSKPYRILPAVKAGDRLAILPIDNLSGVSAPTDYILKKLTANLRAEGFDTLSSEKLDALMKRHRVRYTGGISAATGKALHEEAGVTAVLITSLDSYQKGEVPKVSLFQRLVVCRQLPEIAWVGSAGMSGDDTPGLLGLGLIKNSDQLLDKALTRLNTSFKKYLAGEMTTHRISGNKSSTSFAFKHRFKPFEFYKKASFIPYKKYNVAILPFRDRYSRINRGFVLPLYLMNAFFPYENLNIIEPGLVREALLKYHIVMIGGASMAVTDVLSSPQITNANLVFAGDIIGYQDLRGTPKVDFSFQAFNAKKRMVVCWSRTSVTGQDNTYFFNLGAIHLAHGLAKGTALAISSMLMNTKSTASDTE